MKKQLMIRIIKDFFRFLWKWNEVISLPVAILLFIFIVPLLRTMDPTTISYDLGVFQKPLLVIIYFFFYHAMAWILIKITFPKVYSFLDKVFDDDYNNIDEWKRILISLALFFFYLLCIVLVALSA